VGYTIARLLVLSVLIEAPHAVPASRFNSAQRDETFCRTDVRCGLKLEGERPAEMITEQEYWSGL